MVKMHSKTTFFFYPIYFLNKILILIDRTMTNIFDSNLPVADKSFILKGKF